MKYALLTFGCRVNQADSMAIERDLRACGGRPAAAADADLVVVNSCSVTAAADQGTRQAIRRAARENPSARIVVTGCYATRCATEIATLPGVHRVVPNDAKDTLVGELMTTAERFGGGDGPCGAPPVDAGNAAPYLLDRTGLTLRVQTGCDERCSYCIIPSTRGACRSRPLQEVVGELHLAEAAGYREVTLTGVHLGAYGRDLDPPIALADLLRAVVEHTSRLRIRLGSLEPMDVPDLLVDLAADGRVAPTFHLPLQHASDAVLRRMRRPYTGREYAALLDRIRARLPHARLGSDVIVGFPGETRGDFDWLCDYLRSSALSALHVFPYSDRPGTEASRLGGKAPGPTVKARGAEVREIGRELSRRFAESQTGSLRPALTIGDGGMAVTDNGLKVQLPRKCERNVNVLVRIGAAGMADLVTAGGEAAPQPDMRAANARPVLFR